MTNQYPETIQNIFDQLRLAYLNKKIGVYGYYPGLSRRRPGYFLIGLLPNTNMQTTTRLRDYLLKHGSFECTIEPQMKASSGESYYSLKAWFKR